MSIWSVKIKSKIFGLDHNNKTQLRHGENSQALAAGMDHVRIVRGSLDTHAQHITKHVLKRDFLIRAMNTNFISVCTILNETETFFNSFCTIITLCLSS